VPENKGRTGTELVDVLYKKKESLMSEEIKLIKKIANRMESAGIEYMMTGSMAQALYSRPRMTRDIDIVVQIFPSGIEDVVNLFKDEFYIDKESVRKAVLERGMFNIIHTETVIKVDMIVRKDEDYRVEEFLRRRKIDMDGTKVWVVAPEDLVLSKLVWAKQSDSELQFKDVCQVLANQKDLDMAYLAKWSKALGVHGLLEKAEIHE
jgi:predicted nucleotidyltransferase